MTKRKKLIHRSTIRVAGRDATDEDLIASIADRAVAMEDKHDVAGKRMSRAGRVEIWEGILAKAHAARPIDLRRLWEADDLNFAHDAFGIKKHIDLKTGAMTGFFVPRFSAQREAAR